MIDTHVHFGETVTRLPLKRQSPEEYLGVMRQLGITAAFPAPAAGYSMCDGLAATVRENNLIAEQCERWPDEFPLGFGILELRLGVEAATAEIERCLRDLRLGGMCFVPRLSGSPLGPAVVPSLEVLDRYGGVFLIHSDPEAVQFVTRYAQEFPGCVMVLSHAQRYPVRGVLGLAGRDNVYIDIAQDPRDLQLFQRVGSIISRFPTDRILFGTDAPYYAPSDAVAAFLRLDISGSQEERIAWRNATVLLEKIRARQRAVT